MAPKSVQPFDLRRPLAVWNLCLAIFSLFGFLRTAPHLLNIIWSHGFYPSVCDPAEQNYGHGAAGFWTMLFIFSKIPELFDTLFVVLRKKKLIFLHWYHHVTVLLFCWHSYVTMSSAGLYFVAMNYGVHALMYFYYFLTAVGIHPPWSAIVTALQISQMFVGMFIFASIFVFQRLQGLPCDVTPENFASGLVMYTSYAALFLQFAFARYLPGGGASATGERRSNGLKKKDV